MKANGVILWESPFIVCIATGLRRGSANAKTGAMVQTWILVKAQDPIAARRDGSDKANCGSCPHRAWTCYVDLSRAPLKIWYAYQRGSYPKCDDFSVFAGKAVRLGAYGDPCFVPLSVWTAVLSYAAKWTGYTHRWTSPAVQGYRGILMASADSPEDRERAQAIGWRTFRVMRSTDLLHRSEIACPASEEMWKRTTCERCALCSGMAKRARSIAIVVHGIQKGKF